MPGGLEILADLLVQIKWHILSHEKKQETLQRGLTFERKRKFQGVVQDLFVTNNYGVSAYNGYNHGDMSRHVGASI